MIPAGTNLGAIRVELPGAPVIGQVAEGGQHVHLGKLDGWDDPAPSAGTVTQKVNDHGAFLGEAFYGPRVVQAEARIDGWSPGDSMAIARSIFSALSLNELVPLTVTNELGTLTADVRQEGDPLLARQGNRVILSLSLLAPDPRRYGPSAVASTGLPVSSGGFVLPVVLPVSTGGINSAGALNLYNDGDVDSLPVFTVYGPCSPFTITDDTGRQLAYGESLAAGRTLVIDTATRTALLDGIANRVVTGSWPVLRPGMNTIRFNATTYDAGAQLSVSYRSAWR